MNRRELRQALADSEARYAWLMSMRPKIEGGKDYIFKQNDVWITGVTERPDGTFSSVWMAVRV